MSNTVKYKGKYYPFRWENDKLQIYIETKWLTIKESEIE